MRFSGEHSGPGYRRRIRRALLLLVGLCFVLIWTQGWLGLGLRSLVNRWVLPRSFAKGQITMQRWTPVPVPGAGLARDGIRVVVSPAYLRSVLRASPFPAWLVPPAFLGAGLGTAGTVTVPVEDQTFPLPYVLEIRDEVGMVPAVSIRFTAPGLNRALADAFAEDLVDTEDYVFGTYHVEPEIRFERLHIRSIPPEETGPLEPLRIEASATGWLRYRVQDGWFRKTLRARVRALQLTWVLLPIVHRDGIGFDYRVRIETLDLSVDQMAPWLEKRLARSLRKSLERSLNRRKKRAKFARARLPRWLPIAADLDVRIDTPAEP